MRLAPGGMDIFYIDESGDREIHAMVAVAIPFIRQVENIWTIVWPSHFDAVRDWRRYLKQTHGIPMNKELHGQKLASGRGRYRQGKHQLSTSAAGAIYRDALSRLGFLPEASITAGVATNTSQLYGATKLEAVLVALFQRMRRTTAHHKRNGIVFFDQGHGEYRKLYRRSLVYLPTGSMYGQWGTGGHTRNLPMDNFTKDGNIKESSVDYLIQIADLIAYALTLKIRGERGTLTDWQKAERLDTLYDDIPLVSLNRAATRKDPQGIVRV